MLFAQPLRVPRSSSPSSTPWDSDRASSRPPPPWPVPSSTPPGQREVLLDQLPTLTMPTLVIWGGCDYLLPASHAQAAVDRLPHGRLALFAECGHLPHVECPDRFATVLSEWLAEHAEP